MFRTHSKSLESLHNAEEFEIEFLKLKLIFLLLLSVHEGKNSVKNEWNVCGHIPKVYKVYITQKNLKLKT